MCRFSSFSFFFFNDTATTEIYTLSLHRRSSDLRNLVAGDLSALGASIFDIYAGRLGSRSEEHTSELQSQSNLVCRLLLEKKKNNTHAINITTIFRSNALTVYPSPYHKHQSSHAR